jgi:hypothetical protein
VLEKVSYSFRLELPPTICIHDIFPADKLYKASSDPLPGQSNEEPPPLNITGTDEYVVEKILAYCKRYRSLQYRVQWQGYNTDLIWYKASDLKTSPYLLRDFHIENPALPGPPALLPEWIRLYSEGKDDYNDVESDHAMTPAAKERFLSLFL